MKFIYSLLFLLFFATSMWGQFHTIDLLAGKKQIEIPFEYDQGFIIIKVYLNGVLPLNFIFDTGAENTILLEKEYTHLMGIELSKTIDIIGSDRQRKVSGKIARNVNLSLEKGNTINLDLIVLDDNNIDFKNIIGRNIDGIIGGNFLLSAIVEINYKRNYIRFYNSNEWSPPKNFIEHNIIIKKQRPFVKANISITNSTESPIHLLMDTGAAIHMMIDENSHPDLIMPDTVIDGRIGEGVGGNIGGFIGNINSISFLDENFKNIPVFFQKENKNYYNLSDRNIFRNGIIGNLYWDKRTMIIDYAHEKLYLKKSKIKKKPFRFNKSGIIVFAIGHELDEYIVKHVIKGSVADFAGLQSGDVIKRIHGIPHMFISIGLINRSLSGKEGKKIKLKVNRNGKILRFEFLLKSRKIFKGDIGED